MQTNEELGLNNPKRYDMSKKKDILRWFREMEGYLKTENFIDNGTDREGRVFALDGFRQLRIIHTKEINDYFKEK